MQYADLTFISSGFPPSLVDKANTNTFNLVTVLLHSKFFNDSINAFIDKNKIKQTNIKPVIERINTELSDSGFENYLQTYNSLLEQWRGNYRYEDIKEIAFTLGLPVDFEFDIYLLARYRAFRNMNELPLINYYKDRWFLKVHIDENIKNAKECSGILFGHQVSKRDVHKWVDENWEYIEPRMLEILPVSPLVKTDFQDIEMASEMYDLYSLGKKPTEILNILSDKYEGNRTIYDSLSLELIKNKLSRFKALLAQKETQFQRTENLRIESVTKLLLIPNPKR